ncbi:dephospho-CoA kinase [Flexivirga sp.]|uniref:dephospho-CoA kinase n=1 Tax=Flexivirga sp. TaxID=1962927 RepID=UPI003F80D423
MLYVGLSGGIGSGKSTVSKKLLALGAVVIDADRLAREVVEPGSAGLAEIVERFGEQLLRPDGSLDRPALAAVVFADESARRDLEAITHPRIRALTASRHAQAPREAIVVHDMPLLVEGGLAPDYHLTVIVDTAQQTRVQRIMRDRGMTHDAALARVSSQATDEQRYAAADILLDNNGNAEQLLDRVESLWQERLSPYNDNLLADRPASGQVVTDDQLLGRVVARLERQLASRGWGPVRVTTVPLPDAEPVLVVSGLGSAPRQQMRAALGAAGFAAVADAGAAREPVFGSCDPGAPVRLQLRE